MRLDSAARVSHAVSIVDLIAHTGPEAGRYVWAWRASTLSPALAQGN